MSEAEFKKFIVDGIDYGNFAETSKVFLFFGNKNFTKENFSLFPSLNFQTLKQVHGNKAVYIEKITNSQIEADAQFTKQKNIALAIQTADCLPILSFDQKEEWVCAIHAGWRGIENKIVKTTIEKLGRSSNAFAFSFFVGPHIQQESFEIDKDVAMLLEKSIREPHNHVFYHVIKNKYHADLKNILHKQILDLPIKLLNFQTTNIDTYLNKEYSSYRRERAACRNWSFIYLK